MSEYFDENTVYEYDDEGNLITQSDTSGDDDNEESTTKDSNGNILHDGDSVKAIKDLKVKGLPKIIKRGETIKGIKLTSSSYEIICKIGKTTIALKTSFFNKS